MFWRWCFVFSLQKSNLSITGSSSFFVNSATEGGGVCAWDRSNVHISGNTTFSGNEGGGVSAVDSSNVYISGNTIFSQGLKSGGNTAHFCSD